MEPDKDPPVKRTVVNEGPFFRFHVCLAETTRFCEEGLKKILGLLHPQAPGTLPNRATCPECPSTIGGPLKGF